MRRILGFALLSILSSAAVMAAQNSHKILSRVTEGKQDPTGVVTSVVDGVSYLQELHTSNAKFVLQNGIEGSK